MARTALELLGLCTLRSLRSGEIILFWRRARSIVIRPRQMQCILVQLPLLQSSTNLSSLHLTSACHIAPRGLPPIPSFSLNHAAVYAMYLRLRVSSLDASACKIEVPFGHQRVTDLPSKS